MTNERLENLRILLVSEHDPKAGKVVRTELDRLGVTYDACSSLAKVREVLALRPYNGIVIDVPSIVRNRSRERLRLQQILEFFPVYRFVINNGNITGLSYGAGGQGRCTLERFLSMECARFQARSIRQSARTGLVFNVFLLDSPNTTTTKAERTVTFNLSRSGSFILTSRSRRDLSRIWLVFKEFSDKTPVPCKLVRRVEWGTSMAFPGLGVEFESMSESQKKELASQLHKVIQGPTYE